MVYRPLAVAIVVGLVLCGLAAWGPDHLPPVVAQFRQLGVYVFGSVAALRAVFLLAVSWHVGLAVAAYSVAPRCGGLRWALRTLLLGSPAFLELRRATLNAKQSTA